MPLTVRHKFVSAKADSPDASLVNPSNWNADHTLINFPIIFADDYDFTPLNPSGSLAVGSNTITLQPVPIGVNGTDSNHYLYISGTGTPEAVLITGGSAVSGAPSGTIIVSCVNTHSAGWNIRSATAGSQEAANIIKNTGGTIFFNNGNHDFYGQFTFPNTASFSLKGLGYGSRITVHQTSGIVFVINGGGLDYIISDLGISTGSTPQNVTCVKIGGNNTFIAERLSMSGFAIFFYIDGPTNLNYIARCIMLNPYTNAVGVFCPGLTSSGNTAICYNGITGPPGGFRAGIMVTGSAGISGMWVEGNNIYQTAYGYYSDGTCGQLNSIANFYQNTSSDGFIVKPATGCFQRSIYCMGDNLEVSQGQGISIGDGAGTIDSVSLINCDINYGAQYGIVLGANTKNTTIVDCKVASNSQSSPGTYAGLLVLAGVSKWSVLGGIFGPSQGNPGDSNTQSYGIQVSPGASDNYSIVGAYIPLNMVGSLRDDGTGTHKVIANNLGVDTAAFNTVASATTIALPANASGVLYVTGTVTIASLNGGWIGRRVTLIKTDAGSLNVGGGNILGPNRTIGQGGVVNLVCDGPNWWG